MHPDVGIAPEFSRTVIAEAVPATGVEKRIAAEPAERAALAERFDLVSLDRLEATVRLKRVRGEMVRVTGELRADVVQRCVVTLEPVPASVSDRFTALFAPDHLLPRLGEDGEVDLVLADDDEANLPESMSAGRIDLGELVAQHLSLALDPYPRKPGVAFEPHLEDVEEELPGTGDDGPASDAGKPNPFAALARLRRPT